MTLGYWVLPGETFLQALRRAHAGENPDELYVEYYANSDIENIAGKED